MVIFSSIRLGLAANAKADLCVISSNSLRKPYKLAQCCIERDFVLGFQSLLFVVQYTGNSHLPCHSAVVR